MRGVFTVFFFICMLLNKKRHVRVFIGKHPSLRGREVRVTSYLPSSFNLSFEWIVDRSNPTEVLVENFNSSLAQLDRPVDDPPKTQVKVGRGVQENTRAGTARPRSQTLFFPSVSTNI